MVIPFPLPQTDTKPTKPRGRRRRKSNIIAFPQSQPRTQTLITIAMDNAMSHRGILQGDELTVALGVTPLLDDLAIFEEGDRRFSAAYNEKIKGKVLGKIVRVVRNL